MDMEMHVLMAFAHLAAVIQGTLVDAVKIVNKVHVCI